MEYKKENLVVPSIIARLENNLEDFIKDTEYFKDKITSKFKNLSVDITPNPSVLEAINKLKELENTNETNYEGVFNGTAYDITKDPINKNEIKLVMLVKSGQEIEFTLGLKSYIKPKDQFLTGANSFVTVDWGDGVITQGYDYFKHIYENVDDSYIPFNSEFKQVVITVRPSCYLEDEDVLLPNRVSPTNNYKCLLIGVYNNFQGISTSYYEHSYTSVNYDSCKNLRYFKAADSFLMGSYAFRNCTSLEYISCNKLLISGSSALNLFENCIALKTIDADIRQEKTVNSINYPFMFYNCYSLETIKSFKIEYWGSSAILTGLFCNCFKLRTIPEFLIRCSYVAKDGCQIFQGCMSLENPFQYLTELNMLQNADRLFYGCNQIINAPESLDLSLATNASELFGYCINMETPPKTLLLDSATNCNNIFKDCYSLTKTPQILTTPKATTCSYIFSRCYNLKTVECDLDFSGVSNSFTRPFDYCYSLEAFECNYARFGSKDTTSGHSDVSRYIFQHCGRLKKLPKKEFSIRYFEIGGYSPSTNIEEFPETMNIAISINNITTEFRTYAQIKTMPKVININSVGANFLFRYCRSLIAIDGLTINIPNATSIDKIFEGCSSLKTINNLTINAPNVTNISSAFYGCTNLETLTNVKFNVKPNTAINMANLFRECYRLRQIPDIGIDYEQWASNLSYAFDYTGLEEVNFSKGFKNLTSIQYCFRGCTRIKNFIFKNTDTKASLNYFIDTMICKNIDINLGFNSGATQFFIGFSPSHLTSIKYDFNGVAFDNNSTLSISNYSFLNSIEFKNYANSGNITLDNLPRLKRVLINFKSGTTANIYLRTGNIPVEGLNAFYSSLPSGSGKTLYLKGQANVNSSNTSIATAKGWAINTTT